jgi:hypothetical protein
MVKKPEIAGCVGRSGVTPIGRAFRRRDRLSLCLKHPRVQAATRSGSG